MESANALHFQIGTPTALTLGTHQHTPVAQEGHNLEIFKP